MTNNRQHDETTKEETSEKQIPTFGKNKPTMINFMIQI